MDSWVGCRAAVELWSRLSRAVAPVAKDASSMPAMAIRDTRDEIEAMNGTVTAVRHLGLNHNFARKLALFDGAHAAVAQIAAVLQRH